MYPSALQLDRYFITELIVKANPEFGYTQDIEGKIFVEDLSVEAFTQPTDEDSSRLYCELRIELSEKLKKKYPYSFGIVVVGFFQISPDADSELKAFFMNANAPSILYSAAREQLAAITSRGPHWPLWLPTVSFFKPAQVKAKDSPKKTTVTSAKKKSKK